MTPFRYERAATVANALDAGARPGAAFLAGGTNLVDLMRYGIEAPTALVDITRLHLAAVEPLPGGGVRIGALVRNADLADHPHIRTHFPLLSQALLSGASPQLRNVATTGGNLLQRTRCYYFNDASFSRCNKRAPGSGCAAIAGRNRIHAILGQADRGADSGESCIATHPSDMCVALAALDAAVEIQGMGGTRTVPFAGFHRLPGATPWIDTVLRPGELVVAVTLPPPRFAGNSHYLKARDRRSYAYALVSVAAGLALGGVASKPWRMAEAEAALVGRAPGPDGFGEAAAILLRGAKGYAHNGFKLPLAARCVVRALTLAAEGRRDRPA